MSSHAAFRHTYSGQPPQLISDIEIIPVENSAIRGVYKGVWDTGATVTMITPRIFSELKLNPIDTATVYGVNSLTRVPVVLFDLILPNKIKVTGVRATVSEIKDIDILIGMDIIQWEISQ